MSLINVNNFDDVINFAKEINRLIVVTRGDKGAVAINKKEIVECSAKKSPNQRFNRCWRFICGWFFTWIY